MIISQLPQIQNIDEVHIYHNNKFVKKICVDNIALLPEQIEKQLVPYYFYSDIDYMTIYLEGDPTPIIVLEIMLK